MATGTNTAAMPTMKDILRTGIGVPVGVLAVLSMVVLPLPPIMVALGFDQIPPQGEPGKVTFFLDAREFHYNGIGTVHGGVTSTLLDSAMGCTVQSMLRAGVGYTTTDLHVRYVRAMTAETGRVLADSRVVHAGRKLATSEGRLYAEADPERLGTADVRSALCTIETPPADEILQSGTSLQSRANLAEDYSNICSPRARYLMGNSENAQLDLFGLPAHDDLFNLEEVDALFFPLVFFLTAITKEISLRQ